MKILCRIKVDHKSATHSPGRFRQCSSCTTLSQNVIYSENLVAYLPTAIKQSLISDYIKSDKDIIKYQNTVLANAQIYQFDGISKANHFYQSLIKDQINSAFSGQSSTFILTGPERMDRIDNQNLLTGSVQDLLNLIRIQKQSGANINMKLFLYIYTISGNTLIEGEKCEIKSVSDVQIKWKYEMDQSVFINLILRKNQEHISTIGYIIMPLKSIKNQTGILGQNLKKYENKTTILCTGLNISNNNFLKEVSQQYQKEEDEEKCPEEEQEDQQQKTITKKNDSQKKTVYNDNDDRLEVKIMKKNEEIIEIKEQLLEVQELWQEDKRLFNREKNEMEKQIYILKQQLMESRKSQGMEQIQEQMQRENQDLLKEGQRQRLAIQSLENKILSRDEIIQEQEKRIHDLQKKNKENYKSQLEEKDYQRKNITDKVEQLEQKLQDLVYEYDTMKKNKELVESEKLNVMQELEEQYHQNFRLKEQIREQQDLIEKMQEEVNFQNQRENEREQIVFQMKKENKRLSKYLEKQQKNMQQNYDVEQMIEQLRREWVEENRQKEKKHQKELKRLERKVEEEQRRCKKLQNDYEQLEKRNQKSEYTSFANTSVGNKLKSLENLEYMIKQDKQDISSVSSLSD